MVKRRFQIDAESLPNLPGMMLVTVEALKELGGSATIQELDEKVVELEGVTEDEQAFAMAGNETGRVSSTTSPGHGPTSNAVMRWRTPRAGSGR